MFDLEGLQAATADRPRAQARRSVPPQPDDDDGTTVAIGTVDRPVPTERPSAAGQSRRPRRRRAIGKRRVAAALGWRRLIIAVVIVLLLPGALALTVLSEKRPGPPPAVTGPSFDPLPNVPVGPVRSELDRNRTVSRLTEKLTAPTLLDATASGSNDPDALPTLAITPRVEPYSLAELRDVVPDAFSDVTGVAPVGTLLLKARLQVPLGATLVIDGRTPDVRLASTPAGFATIISRGTLIVAGDVTHPVRISSWDPAPGRPDEDLTDGRPFIMQIGGRMDASHAVFEYLGFNVGISSGVTWNGAPASTPHSAPVKAQGTVTGSVFRHNYVGAYTREAEGMRWVGNTFAFNLEYGYDPHDFSDNFDVAGNVAYHNGKHGFIFSRGCTNNILRGNVSYGNAGHGFMIDDGRSTSLSRSEDRVDGSNNNVLENNDAFGNGGSGIEIEGGTQNSVVGNGLTGHVCRCSNQGRCVGDGARQHHRRQSQVRCRRYVHGPGEGARREQRRASKPSRQPPDRRPHRGAGRDRARPVRNPDAACDRSAADRSACRPRTGGLQGTWRWPSAPAICSGRSRSTFRGPSGLRSTAPTARARPRCFA